MLRVATAEQARRKLREFVPQAFAVIEPETEYIPNWHLDAISEHLEAVSSGQIRKLLLNMPPRHMKSIEVAVMWPVWEWINRASTQFLFSSYGDDLSTRDSVKCRRLMRDPWFQMRWGCPDPTHKVIPMDKCPAKFHLSDDQDTKHYFTNDKGGHRFATSVDAATTGFGGDILVLDDPHNVQEAESEITREGVLRYIDQSWSRRGNNEKTVRKVIVMQRVHEDDATAHELKKGGWVHLCLPAEYSAKGFSYAKGEKPAPNPLSFNDPRTAEGELLWPAKCGAPEIAEAKQDLGDRGYSGQYLQRPYAISGEMFNVPVLRAHIIKQLPKDRHFLTQRGWDLASSTKKTAKRTAGVKMAKDDLNKYYICHVKLGKWRPEQRIQEMEKTMDAEDVKQWVEHEGGSSGDDQELLITKELAGNRIEFVKVSGDKAVRAERFASQCNVGNVYIVDDGTWDVEAYLAELQTFPNGTYLDQVDGSSLVFNKIARRKVERPKAEQRKVDVSLSNQISQQQKAMGVDPNDDWQRKLGIVQ